MASISAPKAAPAASAAAKAAASAREQIAPRSISILVSPPPVNFAERRSVLQVLERHGRVEFFKSVPGHDSMFISLMKEKEAASRLITTSPLSYAVSAPQAPETALSDLNARQTLAKSKPVTQIKTKDTSSSTSLSPDPDVKTSRESRNKEFKIEVWPHPEYRHHISSRSTLHRSWPDFVGEDESFISKTLKQSLPNTMAAKGLANWELDLGKQPTAAASKLKMHERIQMLSWIPGKLQMQGSNRQRGPKDAEPEPAVPSTHNTS
ncbi:hypothetical protein B0J13DRAFT_303196 [Dactylonectria estremocensis]|uniref:Pal1-like protein n=1 Tax=Dactylonectria estremocensis TaxID=1079267 RepID=A0A9P9EWX9_9HYPO|nr:hypothetical protein B0J13DRAFT_303196 [Dactylonectria estremocensis]